MTKSFVHVFKLSNFANSKVAHFEDVYEGFDHFKGVGISKVAQIEDVYEGFDDFWSILESLALTWVPKPARKYIPPQPQPQSLHRESLYRDSLRNPYIGIP